MPVSSMRLPAVLVALLTELKYLRDPRIRGDVHSADLQMHWQHVAVGISQYLHFLRPRGTPHQSLSVRSHLSQYLPDVLLETHVLIKAVINVVLTSILSASSSTK